MLGEAVMPAMATALMESAANAQASTAIVDVVDLFCCGGGFSLGAAAALPQLVRVDGVDSDPSVLRNYAHNLKRLLPSAAVTTHERRAPTSFAALCELLGRPLGRGAHVHASPPCQEYVNGVRGRTPLEPFFRLMLDAAAAGCSCSFEEHRDVASVVLQWLAAGGQEARGDERARLYVYRMEARDYGSPTGRERCVVTTYPVRHERDLSGNASGTERETA
jgi:site-specific DNA-cytosine methylase